MRSAALLASAQRCIDAQLVWLRLWHFQFQGWHLRKTAFQTCSKSTAALRKVFVTMRITEYFAPQSAKSTLTANAQLGWKVTKA
jgi:hypothetical protein